MSSPVKDTPPTFAEQQMLEKQRRYSQLLEDEGSDEIAGYTLTLEGCAPVVVRHDVSTQHTLSWDPVKSKGGDVILESGLCNLYIFPKVTLDDDNDAVDYLGGARPRLATLKRLILAAATDEACTIMRTPDSVGAYPIHGLLVGNTDESLKLCVELFRAAPKLLLQGRRHRPRSAARPRVWRQERPRRLRPQRPPRRPPPRGDELPRLRRSGHNEALHCQHQPPQRRRRSSNRRGGKRSEAAQRPPQQHAHARKGQRSAAQRRTRMAVTV